KLQARVPAILQPVHNDSVSPMTSMEDFPPTRPECGAIRMPRLSPVVRGVVDRPSFSFNSYLARQPGGPTEIHSWTADLYTQFRDFELRLLRGRLTASAPRRSPVARAGFPDKLEPDPEKPAPGLIRGGYRFPKRSCSTKNRER